MKAAIHCSLVVSLLFFGQSAYGQASCSGDGGAAQPARPPLDLPASPANRLAPATPAPTQNSAPQARITVIDAAGAFQTAAADTASTPSVRLTVHAEDDAAARSPDALAKSADDAQSKVAAADDPAPPADEESLHPALKDFVGKWLAVARKGDGELTTVELQLDDRGWAELTVPGPDGKPATTKRRVEYEDGDVKLTGPDTELLLGTIVDSSSRQMVLARSEGQITFVRP